MDPTTQILLALFTILGSGVVTALVTYKLNADRARKEYRQTKLETLFAAAKNYHLKAISDWMVFTSVLEGRRSYIEAAKVFAAGCDLYPRDAQEQTEFLINVHFENLIPKFEKIRDISIELETLLGGVRSSGEMPKNPVEVANKAHEKVSAANIAFAELDRAILASGKHLANV